MASRPLKAKETRTRKAAAALIVFWAMAGETMDRGGLEGRRRPPTPEGHTVTEKLCVLSKGCEWFVNTTVGYDKTALVVLFLSLVTSLRY